MTIPLIDPSDSATFQLDWTDVLPDSVTLGTVTHTVPSPLTKVSESTNTANASSQVRISGAVHGKTYLIEGQSTLSNGETINRQFPLRCFNG